MFGRARQSLVAYEQLERAAREHGKRLWVDQAAWSAARTRLLAFGEIQPALTEMRRMAGRRTLSLDARSCSRTSPSPFDTARPTRRAGFSGAPSRSGHLRPPDDAHLLPRRDRARFRTRWKMPPGLRRGAGGGLQQPIVSLMRCLRLWALFDLDRPEADPAIAADIPMFAGLALERDAFAALAARRREEAEESFLAAGAVWHDNVLRYALRARWAAGELARRGGNVERLLLLKGLERDASRLGFVWVLARTRVSLRLLGRVEAQSPGRRVLSPREREVLNLVSRGLTSKAIASHLGVSPKTVDTHVATSMAKLGATTRLQAAAAAEARPTTRTASARGGGAPGRPRRRPDGDARRCAARALAPHRDAAARLGARPARVRTTAEAVLATCEV